MKSIRVAAAIIERQTDKEREILATQRGYGDYKDWWEFPGGKIEAGETAEEALVREIKEELGTVVNVGKPFCSVEYDYPEFHLSMDCFLCQVEEEDIKLLEHEAAKWLPAKDLGSVRWLPADIEIIELLKKYLA